MEKLALLLYFSFIYTGRKAAVFINCLKTRNLIMLLQQRHTRNARQNQMKAFLHCSYLVMGSQLVIMEKCGQPVAHPLFSKTYSSVCVTMQSSFTNINQHGFMYPFVQPVLLVLCCQLLWSFCVECAYIPELWWKWRFEAPRQAKELGSSPNSDLGNSIFLLRSDRRRSRAGPVGPVKVKKDTDVISSLVQCA